MQTYIQFDKEYALKSAPFDIKTVDLYFAYLLIKKKISLHTFLYIHIIYIAH